MSRKFDSSRRAFLHTTASAGVLVALSPLSATRLAYAQNSNRSRVTIAHGVGVTDLWWPTCVYLKSGRQCMKRCVQ